MTASTINLYGTADDSIVDGPGIRFAVFVQGCSMACPGCHNPKAQPYDGGTLTTVDKLWARIAANKLLSGITLTGGEPFDQPEPLTELAHRAHAAGLNVWAYSGYLFEELAAKPATLALLQQCDVLVDGQFIEPQRSLDLKWRGSANQRIIDVPASLAANAVILLAEH
jgi:anaerobic ribonucleoside-triphosphate reductase activating protein